MRLIDIDDSRNCYVGRHGEYERYNIDPDVLEEALISAEPKRKMGKWIPYSKVYECRYECSSCGYHLIGIHESEANFCPNCGADMRGEQE